MPLPLLLALFSFMVFKDSFPKGERLLFEAGEREGARPRGETDREDAAESGFFGFFIGDATSGSERIRLELPPKV